MIKSICLFSIDYPTKTDPVYSFVEQLCVEFAKNGINVIVIAPQSISSCIIHKKEIHPKVVESVFEEGRVKVYQPYYITLPFKYMRINDYLYYKAAKRVLKGLNSTFDVVYAHFWTPGYIAYRLFNKKNTPLFIATGESNIASLFYLNREIRSFKDYVTGVIAVSTKNKEESIALQLTCESKVKVFPNAIDASLFFKRDKEEMRIKLGCEKDAFIVAFVGWFIDRKGSRRVADAIRVAGDNIFSFFIGEGPEEPDCENILYKGRLAHDLIPEYLSAADIFVLPTKNEGCCNAVIEAMACGLPIVSSDLPFNYDVLNKTNSILVNPNNVVEISEAIKLLKNDVALRKKLSLGALSKAKELTIKERAKKIIDFMSYK